jgi:hypothetical protein
MSRRTDWWGEHQLNRRLTRNFTRVNASRPSLGTVSYLTIARRGGLRHARLGSVAAAATAATVISRIAGSEQEDEGKPRPLEDLGVSHTQRQQCIHAVQRASNNRARCRRRRGTRSAASMLGMTAARG